MHIGTEVIKFQSNSKLGKDLTAAFQLGFDFLNDYDKKNPNVTSLTRADALYKYFDNVIKNAATKAIKDNVNLNIHDWHLIHPKDINGTFAVDLSFGKSRIAEVAFKAQRGQTNTERMDADDIKLLFDISDNIDKVKSRFKTDRFPTGELMGCTFYFDVGMAYLVDELVPGYERLTASEIAAIMMHETGHAFTLLEHAEDLIFSGQYTANMLSHANSNPIQFMTEFKKVLPAINKKVQSSNLPSSIKRGSAEMLNYINTLRIEKNDPTLGETIITKLILLIAVFYITIMGARALYKSYKTIVVSTDVKTVLRQVIERIQPSIMFTTYSELPYVMESEANKASDEKSTNRTRYSIERRADEFVSRHGMSADLGTGLAKLIRAITAKGYIGASINRKCKDNAILKMLYFVSEILTATAGNIMAPFIMVFMKYTSPGYEINDKRLDRLAENTRMAFKDKNVPANVRDAYLSDYEKLITTTKKFRKDTIYEKLAFPFLIPDLLISGIISTITTGRLANDYEKLFNEIDKLSGNKMYYQSAKLNKLANK